MPQFPVIDISCFVGDGSNAQKADAGRRIAEACKLHGFFYVTGHGIPDSTQRCAFEASDTFFALPHDEKKKVPFESGGFTRGYIGMGEESGSHRLEVKEAFSYGYEWDRLPTSSNPMQGPNRWPEESALPLEDRAALTEYFTHAAKVSAAVTAGLSVALGNDESYLQKFCDEGDTISLMRLFKYYPYEVADEREEDAERIGSSPHTDWGWITLILQQGDVTGLQLWHEEAWHDIPPVPGTLLINIGDYVSLLTQGKFKSPVHRVVTGSKERTSFTFFYYPSYEATIPMASLPHDGSIIYTNQADGSKINARDIIDRPFGEFIMHKWEQVSRLDSTT